MALINILTEPIVLMFGIITIGSLIGKIKFFDISLDISAVLITAIVIGRILAEKEIFKANENLIYNMSLFSQIGTAIFVASIGISAGCSLVGNSTKKNIIFLMLGVLSTLIGITVTQCIGFLDKEITRAEILGVLCGALTSTPGLAVLCENSNINAELVMLGYSSSYIIGVICIVVFIQLTAKKKKYDKGANKTEANNGEKFSVKSLEILGISIVLGNIVGNIKIPYINISLGVSGGILCSAILIGFVYLKKSKLKTKLDFSEYRKLGLAMFFVGKGLPAGMQIKNGIEIKWVLYGIIIAIVSILAIYLLNEYVLKKKDESLSVISGGVTSTPAIAVLMKNSNVNVNFQAYSMAYIGALLAMIISMKLI